MLPVLPVLAQNQPPVANAGGDRSVYTGQAIWLNGNASDPDGDAIAMWGWDPVAVPVGADWSLDPSDIPAPRFFANTPGDYVLSLIVLDSRGSLSAPDYATIHVHSNLPPVAVATADWTNVVVGGTVCFDGSQSHDPEAGPLSYMWDFADGTSYLYGTNQACHTFTSAGTYPVLLGVTDERGANVIDIITITVFPPPTLRIALTSTNTVLLAWPATLTGFGFELEENADLTTTNWLPVADAPVAVGDEHQVTLPMSLPRNFFRLRRQ